MLKFKSNYEFCSHMNLEQKIKKSQKIILKTVKKINPSQVAVAWSGGKDSTVLLHLIRKTFKQKIPFKVMFNDSTIEFPEIYKFVKKIAKNWQLDLLWLKHLPEDLKAYHQTKNKQKQIKIMRIAKINVINHALVKYKIRAFISGIRWDEHKARAKEKYFSLRSDHLRIHPILHFTVNDIWQYTRLYKVPYVSLCQQGYKSLGEAPLTKKVKNKNAPERDGREITKEKIMAKLRKLGYW